MVLEANNSAMLTVELEDHQSPASVSSDIPPIAMYLHLLDGFWCDRPHEVADFTCMDLSEPSRAFRGIKAGRPYDDCTVTVFYL